jgi:hypothetical protein
MRFEARALPAAAYPNGGVRRHPRSLFSVPIIVQHLAKGGVRSDHGISLDISEGGMGALLPASLQVGEMVGIELPLPMHSLSTIAIVRYASDVRSGFEFLGLTAEERSQIAVASAPLAAGVRAW